MRLYLLFLACLVMAATAHAKPSEELFDKLKSASNDQEAAQPEADMLAALLESGSATVDLLMERANIAAQAGDLELTRALYDRVIILSPEFSEGWFQRSALFLQAENYPEALRDLNEVLRVEPRHFPAWYRTGAVLESLGSREEALAAFEKSIEIHPNFTLAKRAIARLSPSSQGPSL